MASNSAVIDTGFWKLDSLDKDSNGNGRVAALYDAVNNTLQTQWSSISTDVNGHGTHITSLIASSRRDSSGRYFGVAPDARIISIKAFGEDGSSSLGDLLPSDAQGPHDVVAVETDRVAHRGADIEERGEVHHRGDAVLAQRGADGRNIGNVALHELAVANRFAMAGQEVVVDHHLAAGALERLGRVAADVAGSSCDQDAGRISGQWRSR